MAGSDRPAGRLLPPIAHADTPEWCPACREWKPWVEWIGTETVYDPEASVVCRGCRSGPPPPVDPMPHLGVEDRKLLAAVFETGSMRGAARQLGLDLDVVRDSLRGRSRPELRRAFQILLEREGLDIFSLTRKMKQLLHSQRAQWNKAKEDWDYFPDNSAQLGTVRHLTKLQELDPPNEEPSVAPVQVNVQTNIFERDTRERPGTIEARPLPRGSEDAGSGNPSR